jgi:hypothetical protein
MSDGTLFVNLGSKTIVFLTTHGHVFYGHFGRLASRISLRVERIFSKFTDRLVALTGGERNDYIEISVCAPDKLLTIHSGVDGNSF